MTLAFDGVQWTGDYDSTTPYTHQLYHFHYDCHSCTGNCTGTDLHTVSESKSPCYFCILRCPVGGVDLSVRAACSLCLFHLYVIIIIVDTVREKKSSYHSTEHQVCFGTKDVCVTYAIGPRLSLVEGAPLGSVKKFLGQVCLKGPVFFSAVGMNGDRNVYIL